MEAGVGLVEPYGSVPTRGLFCDSVMWISVLVVDRT